MEQVLRERGILEQFATEHPGKKLVGVCATCKLSQAAREKALKDATSQQEEGENGGFAGLGRGVSEMEDVDVNRLSNCCMQRILSLQPDFLAEKPLLQLIIEKAGHKCLFLPKFHCELSPIEMVWSQLKPRVCCHLSAIHYLPHIRLPGINGWNIFPGSTTCARVSGSSEPLLYKALTRGLRSVETTNYQRKTQFNGNYLTYLDRSSKLNREAQMSPQNIDFTTLRECA
jgi:hypothetical protein